VAKDATHDPTRIPHDDVDWVVPVEAFCATMAAIREWVILGLGITAPLPVATAKFGICARRENLDTCRV
jgi:hypothetical protein